MTQSSNPDAPENVPTAELASSGLTARPDNPRMKARLREKLFGDGPTPGPHDWREPDPDLAGIVFDGKYSLLEQLGAGGMGIVYRATHLKMEKTVAVKILKPEISDDPEFYARFVREAQSASQIDHPNVVRVSDMGEHEDIIYYVMDHLVGEDLRGMMKRKGRIAWDALRSISLQILDGVGAAHARGIIHRDLKPDNIFLTSTDTGIEVKILDFGIAKVLRSDPSGVSITTDGKILGSPRYMSPEQALGSRPDARSDIYSLGVLLYEALTGVPPFADRLMLKVLKMHVEDQPPPFAEAAPDLVADARLEAAIRKALAKDPDKRFQTAPEFAAALRAVSLEGDERPQARTINLQTAIFGAVVLVAAALGVGYVLFGS